MSENLKPRLSLTDTSANDGLNDDEALRILTRSPHPYHRQRWELLQPSDRIIIRPSSIPTYIFGDVRQQLLPSPSFTKDSTPTTDSGTEADDENFVKRLPAPKARPRKGLRGRPDPISGPGTPLLTPTAVHDDVDLGRSRAKGKENDKRRRLERAKRQKEFIRRLAELLTLSLLGRLVVGNLAVHRVVAVWKRELALQCATLATLLALYPLRAAAWAHARGVPLRDTISFKVPSSFDPAPIFYPATLPILVSLLTSANVRHAMLPNLILSIASLPRALVPTANAHEVMNPLHWLLTCLPTLSCEQNQTCPSSPSREVLVLLYPLHQTFCLVLYCLTTTSLLPAELQLLSIALLNTLVLAASPQALILQARLWIGGLGVIILCGPVIRWGISLARVPKWRFRKVSSLARHASILSTICHAFLPKKSRQEFTSDTEDSAAPPSACSTDSDDVRQESREKRETSTSAYEHGLGAGGTLLARAETIPLSPQNKKWANFSENARRQTLPLAENPIRRPRTHTPSGRRKRSASLSIRPLLSLTWSQASIRKWIYAGWVYTGILITVLGFVRPYVQKHALGGSEPIGWALGYIFGDLPCFRFQVVQANLERWICLPPRYDEANRSCSLGWVQQLRHTSVGEANTRLLIIAFWVAVIVVGLTVVFRLSPFYEVDTRRKVFHFMMVAMFLPAIYVDPAWCALALAIALAIFLLLDLLRASQLPPLSKPITTFLHPYTDGRDHCGPIVISHIFLLIGCAIPLWLTLASLPRTGTGHSAGWEIPTRELSMVTGVVCVGLGDAAASLIGRRYGHHKWLWKGGKSLEGSLAFAVAVVVGLLTAHVGLKMGGWPTTSSTADLTTSSGFDVVWTGLSDWDWTRVVRDTTLCATIASLTEAVLTGGNDNVVVPVILWTCVKSLEL